MMRSAPSARADGASSSTDIPGSGGHPLVRFLESHPCERSVTLLSSLWDLFWYTLVVFAFVAYLLILFQVLTDLFRDRSASAVVKVVWIIFLIVFPYITAFATC